MLNHDGFKGMTALVTGASNGIGAETAFAFASQGAYTLIHYHSDKTSATKVLGRIRAAGGDGELLQFDLSHVQGVHELIGKVNQTGRAIDILINNAGSLIKRTRFLDFTEELWDQVLMLNLNSAFLMTKALLPGMVERKRGFVVNVSSVAARNGGGLGAIAYSTAKGGLSVMTKGLAIRVNAVSPGTVDTNYHRNFSTEQMLAGVRAATPAGRLGTSAEIADVIVFLCSEGARFIHGQVIEINGGFLMV
jgi:NAD(P)-dependent dehydrogenase (short-subunit alcohol dehydrogenase family)